MGNLTNIAKTKHLQLQPCRQSKRLITNEVLRKGDQAWMGQICCAGTYHQGLHVMYYIL